MLHLTGGSLRGQKLKTLSGDRTRPTQAKLRQALFNSLQARIPEARVLDLFAGSGALGFEALSRGAAEVVFVESSPAAIRVIQENSENLELEDKTRILRESVEGVVKSHDLGTFDVVLADPPYAGRWENKLLTEIPWDRILQPGGVFCLEWGKVKSAVDELPDQVPFLRKIREKNYGDSVLSTYIRDET